MKLNELFEYLSYGELSSLRLGGGELGAGIESSNYPQIITLINLGLVAVNKRIPYKFDSVVVQQYSHITRYVLSYDYAISNMDATASPLYILDTVSQPFKEDINQILYIVDENGCDMPFNSGGTPDEISLLDYRTLLVQQPYDDLTMVVHYSALPNRIPTNVADPSTVNVDIHPALVDALIFNVASRIPAINGLTSDNSSVQDNYLIKFERECEAVKKSGLIPVPSFKANLFKENNWL
jgi:hypothetical protein